MVLRKYLDCSSTDLLKEAEILHDVQESLLLTRASDNGFQGDDADFAFGVDLLPFAEVFEPRCDCTDFGLASVRQDDEPIMPEDLRNRVPVVLEITIVSILESSVRGFQLNEDQREAVDETDEIGPTLVHLAGNPKLRGQEEIVVVRIVPVDDSHLLDPLFFALSHAYLYAVLQEQIDFPVCLYRAHCAAISLEFLDCRVDRVRRQVRVQSPQDCSQTRNEYDFGWGIASECPLGPECFVKTIL